MNEEEYGIRVDENQTQIAQAKALERIAVALEKIERVLELHTGYNGDKGISKFPDGEEQAKKDIAAGRV